MSVTELTKESDNPVQAALLRAPMKGKRLAAAFVTAAVVLAVGSATGKTIIEWDFTIGTHGWIGNGAVQELKSTPEGLLVRAGGLDPWIEGPPVDLPGSEVTQIRIRMKSSCDNLAELFYGRAFIAGHSARFAVKTDGQWHDYLLTVTERLGSGTRFRLDPCMGKGEVTVAAIKAEAIDRISAPPLQKPQRPAAGARVGSLRSGALEVEHYGKTWGDFVLKVNGVEMAAGYDGEFVGLILGDRAEWLALKDAKLRFRTLPVSREFRTEAVLKDSDGATWELQRRIWPDARDGTLAVEVSLKADKDRDVIYLPWLTVFPGLGTFGPSKYQGLFAGLEYLGDEPSSSDADIAQPKHVRRTPDPVKITFPLMAVSHGNNYIGIIWEPSGMVAATFDSPDRIYDSGAHVLALSAPAVGGLRFENELYAHTPFRIEAGKPLKASILIIGGSGKSIVPAVRHYVDLKALPALPEFEGGFDAAVNLLAHGWLDSQVNRDGLFRHAVWGDSFGPTPAADAAMFIRWLALNSRDGQLRRSLDAAERHALGKLPAGQPFSGGVSHVQLPVPPLVFGRVDEYVRQRRNEAMAALRSFDEQGVRLYSPGQTDYSRTHFEKHANGLGGRDVAQVLEGAALSGDAELISMALALLDKQTALYADTVPRGAQTWEIPLHTPDILASAHMVRAYALGYIISGRQEHLDQARYWAWTGVPFVYLYPPTPGAVGSYATIAVLGATNWQAPVWFGQPVQWCGLVYCSSLHMLSGCDPAGPWETIAKGITATGLQMSWPLTDKNRQGLLPDFFLLREQISDGPAINPGTVQSHLAELYGRGKLYYLKRLAGSGWFVHAPCAITDLREGNEGVSFVTAGWSDRPYYVLISGIDKEPTQVRVQRISQMSEETSAVESWTKEFHTDIGCLVIFLAGRSHVQIR